MSFIVEDFDLANHQGDLPSPCIDVCAMNPRTGWCEGCLRTIDEIVAWGSATEGQKRGIWRELKRRIGQTAVAAK
jgi:predicted Fe-S protein YdhL (DUF1289 family)